MIGIGIVGLGGMGAEHARVLQEPSSPVMSGSAVLPAPPTSARLPESVACEVVKRDRSWTGARVVAGCDVSAKSAESFAARFPGVTIHSDLRALLGDQKVDALLVAVPTGLHCSIVTRGLKSGRPVLVEKPMARTVAECRRMNETARKTRRLLMIAHCRRFDPYWGAWGDAVRKGRLGRPVLWRHVAAGLGPGRWFMDEKLGGGPLIDGAVHDYDFANWIFGDPESVVSSSIKLDRRVTAIDTGSAVVRYGSGDQLMVSWSWAARGCRLFDVVGPKGFIQAGTGGLPARRQPSASEETKTDYWCFTDARGKASLIKARKHPGMLLNQMKHFIDCIRGKARCASPGTEAIKAVAVAEAILKAGPGGGARPVRW